MYAMHVDLPNLTGAKNKKQKKPKMEIEAQDVDVNLRGFGR